MMMIQSNKKLNNKDKDQGKKKKEYKIIIIKTVEKLNKTEKNN
jgi:hypothetical protein